MDGLILVQVINRVHHNNARPGYFVVFAGNRTVRNFKLMLLVLLRKMQNLGFIHSGMSSLHVVDTLF
jgi:hypothetical protein